MDDLYIGLMSGTSLDGLDASIVAFSDRPHLLGSATCELPERFVELVKSVASPDHNELRHFAEIDTVWTEVASELISGLLKENGLKTSDIRAIGSHGQTIRHEPPRPGVKYPFTIQAGNSALLAELSGIDVIGQLRQRDIAAGGQAAPLAPGFHDAFFASDTEDRAVVNLGGIANISWLPKRLSRNKNQGVIGFDTGPANILIDDWMRHKFNLDFDPDGSYARQGSLCPHLLDELMSHPFIGLQPPKSTGREEFNLGWLLSTHLTGISDLDVLRTLVEFSAKSLATGFGISMQPRQVYLCGGGASNGFLTERIRAHLSPIQAFTSDEYGLPSKLLETIGFAWLAQQFIEGRPGNVPSVTGAKGFRRLGALFPAN